MSISINKSSEATTQINHPISYLINSSTIEDLNSNSFCSPRPGSVTVIGKRVFSNSCISPHTIEESSRFPIPIKSVNRIKRQNTQAKILLKKKQSKVKCQEQPAPPILKPVLRPSFPNPQPRPCKKPRITKKPASPPAMKQGPAERSSMKLSKLIQKSVKTEMNKKKKKEKEKNKEKEKKMKKALKLNKRNSKIRAENSAKFKMEKFAPKTPWGVSDQKHLSGQLLKEIEIQRKSRRNYKTSPVCANRKSLGLSKFLEVAQECGFRARSSSLQEEAVVCQKKRRETSLKVKEYIKMQRSKRKENERNKVLENIQKETKRLTELRVLEVNHAQTPAEKKSRKNLRVDIRLKQPVFEEDVNKIYEDDSSDFVFEPDSALEKELSSFTEESRKERNSFYLKESAALKIQYFFRKFLRLKKAPPEHTEEDSAVQLILYSWNAESQSDSKLQIEADPKQFFIAEQLESPQQIRQTKIRDSIEESKVLAEDQQIVDQLIETTPNQYENISDIIQVSQSFSAQSHSIDSEDPESQISKINNSLLSEKSVHDTSAYSLKHLNGEKTQKPEEILLSQGLASENKGDESPKREVDDFRTASNPIRDLSEDCLASQKTGKKVTPEYIKDISEGIISKILIEIIALESSESTVRSIDKDFRAYIEQVLYSTPEIAVKEGLSSPVKKDLINFLAQLRANDVFKELLDCNIISPYIFETIDIARQAAIANQDIKESQKAHDRAVFDCCNELLNSLRPYGTDGEPAPWDYAKRQLKKQEIEIQSIIIKLSVDIQNFTEFRAGKICDQNFCASSDGRDDETLQNLREEKIGLLIIQNIQENEEKWVEYESQEAQTCIELADFIFDRVLFEIIEIVN